MSIHLDTENTGNTNTEKEQLTLSDVFPLGTTAEHYKTDLTGERLVQFRHNGKIVGKLTLPPEDPPANETDAAKLKRVSCAANLYLSEIIDNTLPRARGLLDTVNHMALAESVVPVSLSGLYWTTRAILDILEEVEERIHKASGILWEAKK